MSLHVDTVTAGVVPERATGVAVLVHGRDQDEQVMLDLSQRIGREDIHYVLPVATQRSWYAGRYFDPVAQLKSELDTAIATVEAVIGTAPGAAVMLCGFSQGGCLAAELAARDARRLAGLAILTGSLTGRRDERRSPNPVPGLAVYASCARDDEWVAVADAEDTANRFELAGAQVLFEALDDREHLISDLAVLGVRGLLDRIF